MVSHGGHATTILLPVTLFLPLSYHLPQLHVSESDLPLGLKAGIHGIIHTFKGADGKAATLNSWSHVSLIHSIHLDRKQSDALFYIS